MRREYKGNSGQKGFTLVEVMVSLAIIIVIAGACVAGLSFFQRNYRASEQRKNMQRSLRDVLMQMSQEIGQAGLSPSGLSGSFKVGSTTNGFNEVTVSTPLTYIAVGNTDAVVGATSFTVSNSALLYAGQTIVIDNPDINLGTGAPEETAIITKVTGNVITIGSTLQYLHTGGTPTNPVPIYSQGIFPNGIWTNPNAASPVPDPSLYVSTTPSVGHAKTLEMFGDIDSNGKMVIVKYVCPSGGSGPLMRYEYWPASNSGCGSTATADRATIVIDNVTGCDFAYINDGDPSTPGFVKGKVNPSTDRFVLGVGVTLTVESTYADAAVVAKKGATPPLLSVTKNYLNIQPRNVLSAYKLDYNNSQTTGGTTGTVLSANDTYYRQVLQQPGSGILQSSCMP